MTKLERFIRAYYNQVIFTKNSLHFGSWSLLFLTFIVTVMFRFTFLNSFQLWVYIISVSGCIILSALNYIGVIFLNRSAGFNWLIIPYVSGIFAIIVVWIVMIINPQNYERTYLSRQFLIYYPIVFPIFTWTLQYALLDVFTAREPRKDPLLKIPLYGVLLPMILCIVIWLVADLLGINGFRTPDYFTGLALTLANIAVPTLFTATSEYWHPELKQARYGEAVGTLKQTKKSKKTGEKKKKLNLKK